MTNSIPDEQNAQRQADLKARDSILAAIDVGTNSIHMVVAKIQPNIPAFTIIAREKSTVRLGDRDPKTGDLTPAAIDRAMKALTRCQEIAKSLQADEIIAVATSAVREAPNGSDFLNEIEQKLGLWVNLISGPEEARRIYLGVLSGMSLNDKPHLIIDIGGGSTELILGDGHEARSLSSTKIGAVRLTHEYITTDPVSSQEFVALSAYIRGMLERPIQEIREKLNPNESLTLVGTSGTIEAIAILQARLTLGSIPNPLHGYEFTQKNLRDWVLKLRSLKYGDRLLIPGISERRAEILLAGSMILLEVMTQLKLQKIQICERSLREGVVVDWMLSHNLIEDRLRYQASVRRRSIYNIAQRFHVNLDHSEPIADFALQIFDQTQSWLHQWGEEERELLWAAAILHNCGHHINHAEHHKHSYYLIRNAELLGFTQVQIQVIANLARYHRKSLPKRKHDSYRTVLSKRYRKVIEQLNPLLRLAVALDRRKINAIDRIEIIQTPLQLSIYPKQSDDDCALELWSLEDKKLAFETTYQTKLDIRVTH